MMEPAPCPLRPATLSGGSFLSTSRYTPWSSPSPSLTKPGAETLISFQVGSHEGLLPVPWCPKGHRGGAGAPLRPEPRVLLTQAGRAHGLAFGRPPNRLGCEARMGPSYFGAPSGPRLWLPEPAASRAGGAQAPAELRAQLAGNLLSAGWWHQDPPQVGN